MSFEQNDLVITASNGFVKIVIYGNGGNDNRNIATPLIGQVWAQTENKSSPQIIQFVLSDKTMIAGANFANIKDSNGNPFGTDINSVLSAILALIAPSSGGGVGDANAANQQLQINEASSQTNLLFSISRSGLAITGATEQLANNQINGNQSTKIIDNANNEIGGSINNLLLAINTNTRPFVVTQTPTIQSAASNNVRIIKTGSTILSEVIAQNTGATTRYVCVYNKSSVPNPAIDTSVLIQKIVVPLIS